MKWNTKVANFTKKTFTINKCSIKQLFPFCRVLKSKGLLLNEIIKEKTIFLDLLTKVSGNYRDMSKLLAQDTALQVILCTHLVYVCIYTYIHTCI